MSIVIVYFSGYGHTAKQAQAVADGVGNKATMIQIDEHGDISDDAWTQLDKADAIIFGSPTYMGTVAWQFKKFAEASSKRWATSAWKKKLAAGFTNSGSMNGDKGTTISYLITFALQHGMLWTGTAMMPSDTKAAQRDDINYLGGYSGLLAQSPSDASPDEAPCKGDLETAKIFGRHVASLV